jgi:hypothetical protein
VVVRGGTRSREAPVEDGGDVGGGAEVAAVCGLMEVLDRVLAGFGGEGDEMGAQGRPGRRGGDVGDDLVGSAVKRTHDPGSDELFGGGMQAIGVALDRLMQPDRRIADFAEEGGGRGGAVIAGHDLFQQFAGVRGATVSGRMTVCRSPSPTTCR